MGKWYRNESKNSNHSDGDGRKWCLKAIIPIGNAVKIRIIITMAKIIL